MLLNFKVENTFDDWLFSVRKAQDERGAIPGIVPTAGWGFAWGAGPSWDDALIELPFQLYRHTGDKKYVEDNVLAIEKYLLYMQSKINSEGLIAYGLDDWAQPNYEGFYRTPLDLTDTLKGIDICDKTAMMAKVVGRDDLIEFCQKLAKDFRVAFNKKYVKNGKITVEEQTAISNAIYYKAVDKEVEDGLKKQLLEVIKRDGEVFTCGVLGARTLFRVLADIGEVDLAYKLITQNKHPSYGYNAVRGLETLAEQFYTVKDGEWVRENGEKHDSLNHHFWGDVSAWFIKYLAGINVNPNFSDANEVEIAPNFVKGLEHAAGKVILSDGYFSESIIVRWERLIKDEICLTLKIPKFVKATLKLPKGYICGDFVLTAGVHKITVKRQ